MQIPGETLGVNPRRSFTYILGSPGVPSRVEVSLKEPNAVGGYSKQNAFLDPFGRLVQEKHQADVDGVKKDVAGRTLVYNGRGEVEKILVPFEASLPFQLHRSCRQRGGDPLRLRRPGPIGAANPARREQPDPDLFGLHHVLEGRGWLPADDRPGRLRAGGAGGALRGVSHPQSQALLHVRLPGEVADQDPRRQYRHDPIDDIRPPWPQDVDDRPRLGALPGHLPWHPYFCLSKTQTIRSQPLGDNTLTFNFTYDSADRLTGTIYWQDGAISSETVTSTYNDTDQLTAVSSSSPYVSDVRHDLFGRPTQITYGNGVVDRKSYHGSDKNFRLSAIQTWKGTAYYQNLS